MPKRIADKRLTDQNWDQDDDGDEILEKNLCRAADPNVLKKRVIMKAKRSIPVSAKSQAAASGVFSNFGGLGHKKVGGFTLKGESSKAFQLPSQVAPKRLFTVSDSSKSLFKPETAPEKPKEVSKEAEDPEEPTPKKTKDPEEEFNCHLTALNRSVFNWIQKHIEDNALVDLSPVFKDYSKHLRSIELKFRRHDDDSDVTPSPKSQNSEGSPFRCSQSLESSPASQPLVTSSQPPVTSSQPLVTSSQPLVTSSQPLVTSSQPPVTSSQPSSTFIPTPLMTSFKPPSANPLGDVIATSAPLTFSGFGTKSMTSSPHVAAGVFKGFNRTNDVTGSDAGSGSTVSSDIDNMTSSSSSTSDEEVVTSSSINISPYKLKNIGKEILLGNQNSVCDVISSRCCKLAEKLKSKRNLRMNLIGRKKNSEKKIFRRKTEIFEDFKKITEEPQKAPKISTKFRNSNFENESQIESQKKPSSISSKPIQRRISNLNNFENSPKILKSDLEARKSDFYHQLPIPSNHRQINLSSPLPTPLLRHQAKLPSICDVITSSSGSSDVITSSTSSIQKLKSICRAFSKRMTSQEEQKEEPLVAESVQVHEDDAFYTKKCKLFYKHEDKYNEKGVGFLYLKPVTSSTKTQLLVRADTTVGTILLNILLEPNLPEAKLEGKNNVSLKCVPFPAVSESSSKLVLMLIRVKTSEDAKELVELINKKRREAMTS